MHSTLLRMIKGEINSRKTGYFFEKLRDDTLVACLRLAILLSREWQRIPVAIVNR